MKSRIVPLMRKEALHIRRDPRSLYLAVGLPVIMLLLFGETLSHTRLTVIRPALVAVLLRYATGAISVALLLWALHPAGLLRQVLIVYALLPPAVTNVVLCQRAGRDAEAVASAVLLGTLVAVPLLPLLLAGLR